MTSARWTPATFEIACGEPGATREQDRFTHKDTVAGETWGPFGINADSGPWGTDWIVTHLPTGYRMATMLSARDARRFCEEIAPLTDWAHLRRCPPEIRDAVFEAYHRVRGSTFTEPAAPAGAGGAG